MLNELDGLIERHGLRSEEQMRAVGKHDVGVQLVMSQGAIVQQGVDEQVGDAGDLKDGPVFVGRERDERNAGPEWARRLSHSRMVDAGG